MASFNYKRILRNRDFILCLGLGLGLLVPQAANWTEGLTLPALAVVMTLSTMGVSGRVFRSLGALIGPSLAGLAMNYLVLGGFILGTGLLLVDDPALRDGFIILASVPPAVAVIPFTDFLGGDRDFSLIGTTGAYLGALGIMPLMALVFFEAGLVSPLRLMTIVLELIVAPLVASRVLLAAGLAGRIEPYKGAVTNWSFFIVVYTVVSLNRDLFVHHPLTLVPVAGVAVASTFVLGLIIERLAPLLGASGQRTTSLVLLGTLKNYGLAGGLALALFDRQTAVPATVSTVFMIVYIIWLGLRKK